MADEPVRRALGRGLAALIGDVDAPETAALDRVRNGTRRVPIEFLRPNPRNPRTSFAAEDLADLAASIREKGIMQPILVRPAAGQPDNFEIIAGERRWRAAQLAGLHDVPILVHDVSDKEALELAIIENVQRADLNALEEAAGYRQLIETFGYAQGELADVIGKSRPHVANTLRLLKLPDAVQAYVRDGRLSAGHARALVGHADPATAAKRIVDAGLNVRQAEALAGKPRAGAAKKPAAARAGKDADTLALEKALGDAIGLKVAIEHDPDGSGELRIFYETLEQLDDVCRRLQNG